MDSEGELTPERRRQLYEIGAGFPLPSPDSHPAEPLFARPPDEEGLKRKWELARRELEQAAEWGKLPDPGSEFIYSPHLKVLRERILRSWSLLADPLTIASCVGLINKMRDDVGASLFGYAILATALLEAGHHEEAERIADLQAHYLKELRFTPGRPHAAEEAETDPEGTAE